MLFKEIELLSASNGRLITLITGLKLGLMISLASNYWLISNIQDLVFSLLSKIEPTE